jgi:hypothetical protein
MTVGSTKTAFTPSEFADGLLGVRLNTPLTGRQGTIAAAVVASRIIDTPSMLRDLNTRVGTTGTVTDTEVDVKVIPAAGGAAATVLNATLDTLNSEADGTRKATADWIDEDAQKLEPGDTVIVEVVAAPTGGADLDFTLNIDARFDPPGQKPALIGGATP